MRWRPSSRAWPPPAPPAAACTSWSVPGTTPRRAPAHAGLHKRCSRGVGAPRDTRVRALQGKHTPQRLPAAVEAFLGERGYDVRRPLPGALEVLL